jgi:hypothetical protein
MPNPIGPGFPLETPSKLSLMNHRGVGGISISQNFEQRMGD